MELESRDGQNQAVPLYTVCLYRNWSFSNAAAAGYAAGRMVRFRGEGVDCESAGPWRRNDLLSWKMASCAAFSSAKH